MNNDKINYVLTTKASSIDLNAFRINNGFVVYQLLNITKTKQINIFNDQVNIGYGSFFIHFTIERTKFMIINSLNGK